MRKLASVLFSLIVATAAFASPSSYDAKPWLDDLAQMRAAIDEHYPNRDWLTEQREVSLDRWFERTAAALRESLSEYEARRAIERLIERFNDGHVALRWPTISGGERSAKPEIANEPITNPDVFCAARGYASNQVSVGTAAALPGFTPTDGPELFRTGAVTTNGRKLGVLRIGVFSPEGYPDACKQAVANVRIAVDKPCNDACSDRLLTEIFAVMTRSMIASVERLKAAHADVLLVDLTRNGGGIDWTEAAARIISPVTLESARILVRPSDAIADRWRDLSAKLRKEASGQRPDNRQPLFGYAESAERISKGLRPCVAASCLRLVSAGFTTGLLPTRPIGAASKQRWATDVFGPAQFPYRESVWDGPVIVLVDDETWSAAEQFASLLRDNDAAIVMGTRTGGAGCGHLYGNNPVTLKNSGAKLEMPNCVRLRRDGSNEVSGIVPDVPTGVRWNDGPSYAGRLTAARLPDAIAQAEAQLRSRNQAGQIDIRK